MKVSIITVCYNNATTIHEWACLRAGLKVTVYFERTAPSEIR